MIGGDITISTQKSLSFSYRHPKEDHQNQLGEVIQADMGSKLEVIFCEAQFWAVWIALCIHGTCITDETINFCVFLCETNMKGHGSAEVPHLIYREISEDW